MLELSISQVQKQLTSILSETTIVVDKKRHIKKAVIMPYGVYEELCKNSKLNKKQQDVNEFLGLLSKDINTDDPRYNEIVE